MAKHILTYTGLKELEEELQELKVVKRKEIAEKIKEARAQGDLSENAEYDAAKDEQSDMEKRIEEIEKILKNAEVIDEDEVDLDKISKAPSISSFATRSIKAGMSICTGQALTHGLFLQFKQRRASFTAISYV